MGINMKRVLLAIAVVLLVTIVGAVGMWIKNKVTESPIACTQEAKLCADGSAVGRTGPNCEFAACPTQGGTATVQGVVMGHVTIGPFCPVERPGVPCPIPPEAYSSRKVVVYQSDEITLKQTGKIDSSGNYKISLPPGKYFVQIQPAGIGPGEKKPVIVISNQTTTVDFDIDTGIR